VKVGSHNQATDSKENHEKTHKEQIQRVAEDIFTASSDTKRRNKCMCSMSVWRCPWFIAACYLSIKVLFLLNALGQLYLLNFFVGTGHHDYGIGTLFDLIQGNGTFQTSFKDILVNFSKTGHRAATFRQ
jgi:hypothetical protein